MSSTEKKLVAIDGTDALAYVILRPGTNASGVVIEAGANGISKAHAAYALRHTAQSWDPDDTVGEHVGEQLRTAHAEITRLRAESDAAQRAYVFDTAELKRDNDRLRADNRRLDRSLADTMNDRDRAQDMADRLAYAIAPIETIGEHSGGNCPWVNAFEITQERDWPGHAATTPPCSCDATLFHQAGCSTT